MQFIIYALLGIIILMLCFVIFLLGRLYENNIMIQEVNEKLEDFNKEISLLTEWLGDKNAEEKE